jgi:hypothetical protein
MIPLCIPEEILKFLIFRSSETFEENESKGKLRFESLVAEP